MDLSWINANIPSTGASRGNRERLRTTYVIEDSPMNTKTREPKNQQSKAEPKRFTPQQVEQSVLKALAPALEAKGGSAHTFADWTMNGHGVVLRLPNGQEYLAPDLGGWLLITFGPGFAPANFERKAELNGTSSNQSQPASGPAFAVRRNRQAGRPDVDGRPGPSPGSLYRRVREGSRSAARESRSR